MRIENDRLIQHIAQVFRNAPVHKPAPAADNAQSGDRVTLSVKAAQIRAVHSAVTGDDTVRTDRVDALRQAIADGSYHVSGHDIARKMIAELNGQES